MTPLFPSILALVVGIAGLVWSADKFVHGASTSARLLGVSPLVIGLTIVALGTSAPEIFTSAAAAWTGAPELAIGNVIGSNIANIGLILGLTTLVAPVLIPVSLMKQEIPVLLLVSGSLLVLFGDGSLDRPDGAVLLLMLAGFIWRLYHSSEVKSATTLTQHSEIAEVLSDVSMAKAVLLMLVGLLLLLVTSNILVWGARNLALAFGIPELVVGLTVVAIGTSLPELATSIASALKGHHELAMGNIVGSNILNILVVLPVAGLITPVAINPLISLRDLPVLLLFTVLLAILVYRCGPRRAPLGRKTGAVFILLYLAYTAWLATHP